MNTGAERQLNELLQLSAEELDISDELDQKLTDSYQDLGNWFKRDNADLYSADSEVYPPGIEASGNIDRAGQSRS